MAQSVPPLLEAIAAEKDKRARATMIEALAMTGDARGFDVLAAALNEDLPINNTKVYAVIGLGRIRDAKALPLLAKIAIDFEDSKDNTWYWTQAANSFGYVTRQWGREPSDRSCAGLDHADVAMEIIRKWVADRTPERTSKPK